METPEMMSVLLLVGVFLAARPLGSVSWRMAVSATGSKPLERWLSRLLLWEALLGPLLSLSTVVIFSVTSTLDGEREGESSLPSTRGRDWTVVTVVTTVPSGMMVRSNSIFLVGVMLGRGVEEVGVPRFRGEPCS